ncbi:MAG TPA: sigma-54-dependent Fis family transcriptional regulator [Candidatus Spyradenecus faecavium]|uniref:Sigma-54-dependent Fis family transcriptional regulator n=1 Tax=Candidatus Spyradenecus faecavium TaxID=2840947 RepID=A0A9D1T2E8_9BACT|nr:sigma-54-dependent Fis family transcriptional regulator [Candidatus Spyradenecus faecavium]
MSRILIVDDDKATRDGLALALGHDYAVLTAADAEAALRALTEHEVDLVLTDLRMPGRDGLSLLRDIIASHPGLPVILLSAYGSVESAVEAMRDGAVDFLTKPVNLDHLELVVRRALRQKNLERQNARLRAQLAERSALDRIIGSSEAMLAVRERIEQVAPTPATVLIQGPSGTGKELVARALHALSPRSGKPFVAVHCAALAPSLLESELFGHVKGAFTGATEDRKGRFEIADGGTLFLDEISEIDLATQVKLLRVLETRTVEPVGSATPIPVDIRLVAATNRDLRAWVDAGKFREDLYFRLNVVDINLPPLRERQGDLPLLCDAFVREFNPQLGRGILGITPEAMAALAAYPWPGNVRELRNAIERMMVLAHGDHLTLEDVPKTIREGRVAPEQAPAGAQPAAEPEEATLIRRALFETKGNRTAAAKRLGIPLRTLYRRIKTYGLEDVK